METSRSHSIRRLTLFWGLVFLLSSTCHAAPANNRTQAPAPAPAPVLSTAEMKQAATDKTNMDRSLNDNTFSVDVFPSTDTLALTPADHDAALYLSVKAVQTLSLLNGLIDDVGGQEWQFELPIPPSAVMKNSTSSFSLPQWKEEYSPPQQRRSLGLAVGNTGKVPLDSNQPPNAWTSAKDMMMAVTECMPGLLADAPVDHGPMTAVANKAKRAAGFSTRPGNETRTGSSSIYYDKNSGTMTSRRCSWRYPHFGNRHDRVSVYFYNAHRYKSKAKFLNWQRVQVDDEIIVWVRDRLQPLPLSVSGHQSAETMPNKGVDTRRFTDPDYYNHYGGNMTGDGSGYSGFPGQRSRRPLQRERLGAIWRKRNQAFTAQTAMQEWQLQQYQPADYETLLMTITPRLLSHKTLAYALSRLIIALSYVNYQHEAYHERQAKDDSAAAWTASHVTGKGWSAMINVPEISSKDPLPAMPLRFARVFGAPAAARLSSLPSYMSNNVGISWKSFLGARAAKQPSYQLLVRGTVSAYEDMYRRRQFVDAVWTISYKGREYIEGNFRGV